MYCKNCGKQLDDMARFCDSCGASTSDITQTSSTNTDANPQNDKPLFSKKFNELTPRQKRNFKIFVGVSFSILAIFIIIAIVSALTSNNNKTSGLTYNNYVKIENGMTYNEVCEILGNKGQLSTEAGSGNYNLKYYTWQSSSTYDFKIITIGFENGRVCAKSQVGLT